jgi:hypothetical protein
MGGTNVRVMMAAHGKLEHGPMRLLTHMAAVSLDPPGYQGYPPCIYWAGPELQRLAMGYPNDAFDRMLRDFRAALIAVGAINRLRPYRHRRHPSWLIMTGEQPELCTAEQWLAGTVSAWERS